MIEWKNFRSKYYDLDILRSRLSKDILLLCASATLKSITLKTIRERCDFDENHRLIKIALDRLEIYLQINQLQKSQTSMLDLRFFLFAYARSASDISKIIVFIDNIKNIIKTVILMKIWMK